MKRILKIFIQLIISSCSKILTYSLIIKVQKWKDSLYTMWLAQFLGNVEKGTCISYPILLEGGGQKNIYIGSHSHIGSHSVLGSWSKYGVDQFAPMIVIGNDCSIGEYCHITAINKIYIGNGLLTGRFVYIGDNAHGGLSFDEADICPSERHLISKGEVKIGNNVWIGDKVSILSGVTIGDNVIIGTGSVVTHDIPSNSLAVGVPSRVIKTMNR